MTPDEETFHLDPRRAIGVLIRVSVTIVVLGTLVSVSKLQAGTYPLSGDLRSRFELHTGLSLPGWFGAILFLIMVPPLIVLARKAHGSGDRADARAWTCLALLVTVFSVDEVTSFHVFASLLIDVQILGFHGGYNWVVFGMVAVVALVVIFGRFIVRLPEPLRFRFVLGSLLFFGGAVGIEMINAHTASTVGDANYRYLLLTSVEEAVEMVGVLVIIYGLLEHVREEVGTVVIRFGPEPSTSQTYLASDHEDAGRGPE